MANLRRTVSVLLTRTCRECPISSKKPLSAFGNQIQNFHSVPTHNVTPKIDALHSRLFGSIIPSSASSSSFSCASSRVFSTSSPLDAFQRFKKAGDVEAASKAKREAGWRPPKTTAKAAEEPAWMKMAPEELERWLAKKPVDDVWLAKHYPERVFALDKIVEMNRQANDPSMLDNPDGDLMVELSLNMQGLKATKPIKPFQLLTHVPFKSPHTTCEPRDVAVLVKNEDLARQIEERGAAFVGGEELILKIKSGLIQKDSDYDYLIAHMDIIQELGTLLKKKHMYLMPTEKEGTLGVNLMEMFDLHQNGYLLQVKSSGDPMIGSVTFSLGKLSHSLSEMCANLDVIMKILRRKRPANLTAKRGVFVTGATVKCPPNTEIFQWDVQALNDFMENVEVESVFEEGEKDEEQSATN